MIIDKLTLLTCSFNSNLLTTMMIKSIFKQLNKEIPVVIMDNSTKEFCTEDMKTVFTVIDNTNYKLTPNYNQVSKNHCASIDYAFKNYIKTKYVMLCDCDILFKPKIKELLNSNLEYDAIGEISWDVTPPNRLLPYFCIINVEKFKNEKLNYFDVNRCMKLYDKNGKELPNEIGAVKGFFDTGCSFYEDIKNSWSINQIKLDNYIVHLKGACFRNKNITEWLKSNSNLF